MAPKGRKSVSTLWHNCAICGVTLTYKDMRLHTSNVCPPDLKNWEHSFIRDNILYSYIDTAHISDVPDVGFQEKTFFVYISQSAMQLCNFEIGENVLVVVDDKSPIILKVWPTSDRTLMSVTIPKEVRSGNNHQSGFESKLVKVQKLLKKALPAFCINLTTKQDIRFDTIQFLKALCKQKYTGKLIKLDTRITVQFYGRCISFRIVEISSVENSNETLMEKFEELNIVSNNQSFFLVIDSTDWQITTKIKEDFQGPIKTNVLFNSIGGYGNIKKDLLRTALYISESHESSRRRSLGVLLHGPHGIGKTLMGQALCNEMGAHVVHVNSGELFSKFYGETEIHLNKLFNEAKQNAPSIIVMDNIDTFCPKRGGTDQERRVIGYLLSLIDSLKHYRTMVLAMTSQLNVVDSSLRRPGRLDSEIEFHVPKVVDRLEILRVLLAGSLVSRNTDLMQIASVTHGFVAADLECMVAKAVMQASLTDQSSIDTSSLMWALSQVKPSAMREAVIQVPNVMWTDIGGMDDLKLKLKQAIEWPLTHPEAFSRLGISPPRGVLMYGPPGCSKTMIAKALATESKLNFLTIKGSELFSKWVGESEKAVETLFRKARTVAPSIVFLDEIDAIGGERSSSTEGSNVQERVLAQLLTEMDGIEPLGNVNIIAATNRPDRVDKALLRPGRLDRLVYVPLPDSSTRQSILLLQLLKMPVSADVEVDGLAKLTAGYSGAEVVAVCHEAAISALQEDFNTRKVCAKHFHSALLSVKPRTPPSLLSLYDNYLNSRQM